MSELDDEVPLTVKQREELLLYAVGALSAAHKLIVASIEGNPIDYFHLESYFNHMYLAQAATEDQGLLLSPWIDDLSNGDRIA